MGTKKAIGVFVVVVVVAVAVIWWGSRVASSPSQQQSAGGSAVEPGYLPTWSVGDRWGYKSSDNVTYTYVVAREEAYELPLDNTFYYAIEGTVSPATEWGGNIRQWCYKTTLEPRVDRVFGGDRDQISTLTYTYSADPWPLAVGKSYTVGVSASTDYTVGEGGETHSSSRSLEVTVENIENVSVPAGVFECFKIVTREGGTLVETSWYSDVVKREVKRVDHSTGGYVELTSYQVG